MLVQNDWVPAMLRSGPTRFSLLTDLLNMKSSVFWLIDIILEKDSHTSSCGRVTDFTTRLGRPNGICVMPEKSYRSISSRTT